MDSNDYQAVTEMLDRAGMEYRAFGNEIVLSRDLDDQVGQGVEVTFSFSVRGLEALNVDSA